MITHVPPLTQFKEQDTLKKINIINYKHNIRTLNRKNETFSQNINKKIENFELFYEIRKNFTLYCIYL